MDIEPEECFKKLELPKIDTSDPDFHNSPVEREHATFESGSDYDIFVDQIESEIPLQRLVAAKRIEQSCKSWSNEEVLSVVPQIKQLSFDKEMIIRQTTAKALGSFASVLCNDGRENTHVIINDMLPLINELLKDTMEVRQAAIRSVIILASSKIFNIKDINEHIVQIACDLSTNSTHDHKITALQLFGELASIIGSQACKDHLCDKLKLLSRDPSFRVKKMAAQQFGAICKELSSSDTETHLLPVFIKLCNDSIWSVRNICAECLLSISSSISSKARDQLIDIQMKLLNDSSRWVRNTAYQHLGPFISSLNSQQVSKDLLSFFISIPHLSSVTADANCTDHCAFNFPAVALTIGAHRWHELNETYNILCRKTIKCRQTLACSAHEIARILGSELCEKYLLESIELFLRDVDEIRSGIVKNLAELLAVFSEELRAEYINTLWQLASEPDSNWRFRLFLSQQFEKILPLYSLTQLKQQIVPLIFELCQDRMADVRYAAVEPIADAMNILSRSADDEDLQCVTKTIETLYSARTYSKRLLYIRIADACFGRIEQQLFDSIFLKNLVNYAKDKIINVRYCLARFINKQLAQNERYKDNEAIQNVVHTFKNDEQEDVEIKRFFMSADEIEAWLQQKKDERDAQHLQSRKEAKELQNFTTQTLQNSYASDAGTDSSVYSTDSDDDNDDDSNLNMISAQLSLIEAKLSKNDDNNENNNKWIIIDNGSYLIKAGIESEQVPRVIRPSCVKYETNNENEREIKYAMQRGVITSMDDMECIWYDILYNELGVDPSQRSILLSEKILNPKCNQEKILQSMFETFNVQSIAIVNDAVLAFYASGLTSGVSCVIGDGVTQIAPISNGYALNHAMIRKDLGGNDVTNYLRRELNHFSSNSMEIEIVRDIKHKYSFVYDDEDDNKDPDLNNDAIYTLPDGNTVTINRELRFKCNQVLFEPQLMDINGFGVHELLNESYMKCNIDSRHEIWSDQEKYWITGGVTATNGFMKRMRKEVNILIPAAKNSYRDKVASAAFHKHAKTSVYVGGSIFAESTECKTTQSITSHQYDEDGINILYKK